MIAVALVSWIWYTFSTTFSAICFNVLMDLGEKCHLKKRDMIKMVIHKSQKNGACVIITRNLSALASHQIPKLWVVHAPGMPGTFYMPLRVSDPDMNHGTCVTHVLWCMPGSLTSGFLWSRWRGKRSRLSRRMRNPQFYVSGKSPTSWRHHTHTINGNPMEMTSTSLQTHIATIAKNWMNVNTWTRDRATWRRYG